MNRESEVTSKLCSLEEAIARYAAPGSNVYLSQRAYAAVYGLLRRFHGTAPRLTLTSIMVNQMMIPLLDAGMVRRIVASTVWDRGARNSAYQRGLREGTLEVEQWTIHTLILRLMAGGSGVPFLPTRSIIGSSMAQELPTGGYMELDDPFGSGCRVALVSALRPDLAFVHALVADPEGDAVLVPDWTVDCWGARACRGPVVVMAEGIVSTDALRDYAPFVKIPAYMVAAVCPVRFGAFPEPVYNGWVKEVAAYSGDRGFSGAYRKASRAGGEELDSWLRDWILSPPTHEAFLEKLGQDRLESLQGRAREELAKCLDPVPLEGVREYSEREAMIVWAARKIAERAVRSGYKFIQTGPGPTALATYLAYYKLQESGRDVEVMSGFGMFGYTPLANSITSMRHQSTAKMFGDMNEMYGAILCGPESQSLAVLGIAEVDKSGNVNTSRLADGRYLEGSGGHNDCVMGASEVLLVAPMELRRFRDHLNFVTSPGDRVRTLVTDWGVLEKPVGKEEFALTSYRATSERSVGEDITAVRQQCGWNLQVSPDVAAEPPPLPDELIIIRRLDPEREVLG